MPSSSVLWDITESIGTLTFNRPHARNALTWEMYDALERACDEVDAQANVRALIIRGEGGSFAAGTDISQFAGFSTGDDGLAYERRLDALVERLENVTIPTIAQVDGAAVGGGCLIALACDLRVCSDRVRYGVPVARTLGNCLSMANLARLTDLIGPARTRDLLLTGRLVEADEALALGLATRVVPVASLGLESRALALELTTRAPSTIVATKALLRRLRAHRLPPAGSGDDIVAACYASDDFREGVAAFTEGRRPRFG
jgi:enoyl-CoA hydratase/carnithine racemase